MKQKNIIIAVAALLFFNTSCTKKNLSDLAAAEDSQSENSGTGNNGGDNNGGDSNSNGNFQFDDLESMTQFLGTSNYSLPLSWSAIKFASDDSFYVASALENAIYKFDSMKASIFKIKLNESIAYIQTKNLATDTQNNLWLSTGEKTLKISQLNGEVLLTLEQGFSAIQWQSSGHIVLFKEDYNSGNQISRYSSDGTLVHSWAPMGSGQGECAVSGAEALHIGTSNSIILSGCQNARLIQFDNTGVYQNTVEASPTNYVRVVQRPNGHFVYYDTDNYFKVIDASGSLQWGIPADLGDSFYFVNSNNQIVYLSNNYLKGYEIVTVSADGQSDSRFTLNLPANIPYGVYPLGFEIIGVDQQSQFIFSLNQSSNMKHLGLRGFFRVSNSGTLVDRFPEPTSDSELLFPSDMVVDQNGNYTIVDQGNSKVKKFDSDGQLLWTFGGIQQSQFSYQDVMVRQRDNEGNIYHLVSSNGGHNFIKKYSSDGEFLKQFGGAQQNQGQFYDIAYDMAIDAENEKIYVLDQYQVVVYGLNGNFISSFAGSGNDPNDSCGNLGSTGNIYQGKKIALQSDGSKVYVLDNCGRLNIYLQNGSYSSELNLGSQIRSFFVDTNNKVHVITDASIERYDLGSGVNQEAQFSFDNLDSQSNQLTPSDLVIFNNKYYILAYDQNTNLSSIIRQSTTDGSTNSKTEYNYYLSRIGISGNNYYLVQGTNQYHSIFHYYNGSDTLVSKATTPGYGDQELLLPNRITSDSSGNLYVTDYATGKVVVIDENGQFVKSLVVNYDFGRSRDLAIDSADNLFFVMEESSTQNRIYRVSAIDGSGTNFTAAYDHYQDISRIAINSSNQVYFLAYSANNQNTIKLYQFLNTATSIGSGTTVSISSPIDLESSSFDLQIDQNDQKPLLATQNGIYKFNNSNAVIAKYLTFGTGKKQFNYAAAIHMTANGQLMVLDMYKNSLLKFPTTNLYFKSFSNTQISSFVALASGDFYVSDGSKVLKLNPTGQFYWDSTAVVTMTMIGDMVADGSGNLYVSDPMNHIIHQLDSTTGGLIASIGTSGSSGSGDGQLNMPIGLEIDQSGNLIVADYGNQRVQVFNSQGVFQRKYTAATAGVGIKPNGNHIYYDPTNDQFVEIDQAGQTVTTVSNADLSNSLVINYQFDDDGNMYMIDQGNLMKFDPQLTKTKQINLGSSSNNYGLNFHSGYLFTFANQINVYDTNFEEIQ